MDITMHEVGLFSWGFTAGMLYVWGGNKIVDKLIERQTARIDAEAEAERLAGAGVNEILARSLRGDADAQMDCAKLMRAGWPGLAEVHKRTSKGILGRLREMVLDPMRKASKAGDVTGSPVSLGGWKKAVSRFIRLKLRQFGLQLFILQLQVENELLKLLILRKQRAIAGTKPTKRAAESPEDHAPDQAADSGERTDDADSDSPLIKPNGN